MAIYIDVAIQVMPFLILGLDSVFNDDCLL